MTICIQGATTAQNTRDDIIKETAQLLDEILNVNLIRQEDIISIIFTATKDLDQAYPAVAARMMGIKNAALMCFQEMYVAESMVKCIRVTVTVESGNRRQEVVEHVYLNGAKILKPR